MSEATICWLRSSVVLLLSGVALATGPIGKYRLPFWHVRLLLFELLILAGREGELIADDGYQNDSAGSLSGADGSALDELTAVGLDHPKHGGAMTSGSTGAIPLGITDDQVALGSHLIHFLA
jgi:hypothetical protein